MIDSKFDEEMCNIKKEKQINSASNRRNRCVNRNEVWSHPCNSRHSAAEWPSDFSIRRQ